MAIVIKSMDSKMSKVSFPRQLEDDMVLHMEDVLRPPNESR